MHVYSGLDGMINMVITKFISRLHAIRRIPLSMSACSKGGGIAVFFGDENNNTLSMDSDLLLVVLSSVAQQEVENTSQHVKKD